MAYTKRGNAGRPAPKKKVSLGYPKGQNPDQKANRRAADKKGAEGPKKSSSVAAYKDRPKLRLPAKTSQRAGMAKTRAKVKKK